MGINVKKRKIKVQKECMVGALKVCPWFFLSMSMCLSKYKYTPCASMYLPTYLRYVSICLSESICPFIYLFFLSIDLPIYLFIVV